MTAYSFKKQFVEPIRAGTKRQTIRLPRKGRVRFGGGHAWPQRPLQLYCGMRTKHCFLIGRAVCERLTRITIDLTHSWVELYENGPDKKPRRLNCWGGSHLELDPFAVSDGFADWESMWNFWAEVHGDGFVFDGFLIEWGDTFTPATEDEQDAETARRRLKEFGA
jgi:hypothetical protein